MRTLTAGQADNGRRADVFVAARYPDFSRSSLDGLFDNGLITISGKPVKQAQKIKSGDRLTVDDKPLFNEPSAIRLPVIYEDNDVLVIDKPAGILTHSKGALNTEATVASFIKDKLSQEIPASNRAGIVHRLDRATSGVIITAKSPAALAWLQKQFSSRRTKKVYTAIAEGKIEPARAIIDAPVARNPRKPQTFSINPAGKPATTEYAVQKLLNKAGNPYSVVELRPWTGRTHQLRVHLAYIKHPIVGDRLYGRPAEHMYLHAKSLELTLPNQQRKVFVSKEPDYFVEFIENV